MVTVRQSDVLLKEHKVVLYTLSTGRVALVQGQRLGTYIPPTSVTDYTKNVTVLCKSGHRLITSPAQVEDTSLVTHILKSSFIHFTLDVSSVH